jgi:hypothetical protein
MSGLEGIWANISLSQLNLCVQRVKEQNAKRAKKAARAGGAAAAADKTAAAAAGKKKKKSKASTGHVPFRFTYLTRFLSGSLVGRAVTSMLLTLSQAPRNGDESFQSLQYGESMSGLETAPSPQPSATFAALAARTAKECETNLEQLERTNVEKYVVIRRAEVRRAGELLDALRAIADSDGAALIDAVRKRVGATPVWASRPGRARAGRS